MRRLVVVLTLAVCAAFLLLLTWVAWQVDVQSQLDEAHAADLIVILGAAEYRGFPSPVLKSRLDHGLRLFQQGLAARILTTGGSGGDPDFTEGEVGRNYLVRKGVPSEAIIVEPEGESTVHSIAAVGEIMARNGYQSCVLVTDGYHVFRAKNMLQSRGIRVYGSPRPGRQAGPARHWWLVTRQAAGYLLWSIGLGR